MLASRIMHPTRRTTVTASEESLRTLEAEAQRRQSSLSAVLAEAIDEKARAIREHRRPRVGMGRSSDGRSAAEVSVDPVAHEPR
jgi:hypothetical protein